MTNERIPIWFLVVLVAWSLVDIRVETAGAEPRPIVSFRLAHAISTKTAQAGDSVDLRTTSPITVGALTIPASSPAHGIVTRVVRPGRIRGRGLLALRVVSVTHPDGRPIPLTVNAWEMETPRRGPGRASAPDPTIAILTGMAAGYGGAVIASQFSDSAESIAGAGIAAGVATIVLVAVLRRGEDLVLHPGFRLDVTFATSDVLAGTR